MICDSAAWTCVFFIVVLAWWFVLVPTLDSRRKTQHVNTRVVPAARSVAWVAVIWQWKLPTRHFPVAWYVCSILNTRHLPFRGSPVYSVMGSPMVPASSLTDPCSWSCHGCSTETQCRWEQLQCYAAWHEHDVNVGLIILIMWMQDK